MRRTSGNDAESSTRRRVIRALLGGSVVVLLAASSTPAAFGAPSSPEDAAIVHTAERPDQRAVSEEPPGPPAAEGAPEGETVPPGAGEQVGGESDVSGTSPNEGAPGSLGEEQASAGPGQGPDAIGGTRAGSQRAELQARAAGCSANVVYGVSSSGKFFQLSGGVVSQLDGAERLYSNWTPPKYSTSSSNVPTKNGVNGLAVAADGTMYAHARSYAYDSSYPSTQWWPRITLMMKPEGKPWQWFDGPEASYRLENDEVPIAGAISPTTGNYLFGGFEGSPENGRAVFVLREVDLASKKSRLVGRVDVGAWNTSKHPTVNGDIALDSAGNLYIVRHTEDGRAGSRQGPLTITSVQAAAMSEASGGRLRATTTSAKNFTGPVAGIATAPDGYVYVSGATDIRRVHPTTLAVTNGYSAQFLTTRDGITDLASCALTNTLELRKHISSRYSVGDQFRLAIAAGGAEIAEATTTGASLGLQEASVGPILVAAGSAYELSEHAAHGALLANYDSAYSCVDQSGKKLASGQTSNGTVTIPAGAAGLEVTCTFSNTAHKPAVDPGACTADGNVYGISSRGQVALIPPAGQPTVDMGASALVAALPSGSWKSGNYYYAKGGVNGLGIAEDGTMYAYLRYQRAPEGGEWTDHLAFLTKSPGQGWQWAEGVAPFGEGAPMNPSPLSSGRHTVVGAVDPITGKFKYGWFRAEQKRTVLDLWEFNAQTRQTRALGHVTVDAAIPSGKVSNGDIAFDELGNLYVLHHATASQSDGVGPLTLTTVTRQDFAKAQAQPGQAIAGSTTRAKQGQYDGGAVNGIAVRPDGTLAISTQKNVFAIDPTTAHIIGAPLATTPFPSDAGQTSDLASCARTMTLTVQKHIDGRVVPTDQFKLTVENDVDEIASATTHGSAVGLQPEQVGPVLIRAGQTYAFSEEGVAGAELANYRSHFTCKDSGGAVVSSGQASKGKIAIPSSARGQAYTCVITNTPRMPELELTKVDADDTQAGLAGAKFQLWRDADGDGRFDRRRDQSVGNPQVTQQAGHVSWASGLSAGTYFVEEVSAPPGYMLPSQRIHTVQLLAQKVALVVENSRLPGTVTWTKIDTSGTKLAGSEWKLVGPEGAASREISVTDCVADRASRCTGPDTDPRAGEFAVRSLAWGNYALTETVAPAGFTLDKAPHEFRIGPSAPAKLEVDLGEITNLQQEALAIPLTGGVGVAWFIGIGALLSAVAIGAMVRRQRTA